MRLNVRYRDFRCVIPFIVQFGIYVSPVGFSSSVFLNNGDGVSIAQPDGRCHRWLPLVAAARGTHSTRSPCFPLSL